MGKVIGTAADSGGTVCTIEIDPAQRFHTYWLSVGPCYGESKSIYLRERRIDTYGKLTSDGLRQSEGGF
jgi:hypothetical protein